MERKTFFIEELPKDAPYSPACEAGGFVFVSGVVPVNLVTREAVRDDVRKAAVLVMENIKKILAEAGVDLGRVVKATVFLADMRDYDVLNEVYLGYFPKDRPARTCVAVKELPGGYPLEIEVIAYKG